VWGFKTRFRLEIGSFARPILVLTAMILA